MKSRYSESCFKVLKNTRGGLLLKQFLDSAFFWCGICSELTIKKLEIMPFASFWCLNC